MGMVTRPPTNASKGATEHYRERGYLHGPVDDARDEQIIRGQSDHHGADRHAYAHDVTYSVVGAISDPLA